MNILQMKNQKCKCGCDKEVRLQEQDFISGHQNIGRIRSQKLNKEHSIRMTGDNNPSKRKEVKQKISKALTGEKNGMWKKNAGYWAIHNWVSCHRKYDNAKRRLEVDC